MDLMDLWRLELGQRAAPGVCPFPLWQYRLVDAFWFINVEKRFDLGAAEAVNADVWGKVAALSARDIKKRFAIATMVG
jgi:hypothetical protein